MNSENSKTYDPHRLILSLPGEIDSKRKDKYIDFQILVFIIHGKILKSYKKSKFKTAAPTWDEELKLPDGSYSVSGIQDYF